MDKSLYYRHSGKAPAKAVLLALIFIPVSAGLSAWAYVSSVAHIPFVFINFILTLIFSLLGSIPIILAVQKGKVRNTGLVVSLAVLAGVIAVYVQWAVYCSNIMSGVKFSEMSSGAADKGIIYFLMHPMEMKSLAHVIEMVGTWSLSGSTVKGIPLLIVWLGEAALTILPGIFFTLDQLKKPFSEAWDKWLEEERSTRIIKPLKIAPSEIGAKMESGDLSVFNDAETASPSDKVRYELAIYRTEDMNEIYFSLFEVKIEMKRGRENKKSKTLIKQMIITKAGYEKLAANGFYQSAQIHTSAPAHAG